MSVAEVVASRSYLTLIRAIILKASSTRSRHSTARSSTTVLRTSHSTTALRTSHVPVVALTSLRRRLSIGLGLLELCKGLLLSLVVELESKGDVTELGLIEVVRLVQLKVVG